MALSVPQLWEDLHLDFGHTSELLGLLENRIDVLEFWTSHAAHLHHASLRLSFDNRDSFVIVGYVEFLPFEELFSLTAIPSARLLRPPSVIPLYYQHLFSTFLVMPLIARPMIFFFKFRKIRSNHVPSGKKSNKTPSLRRLALNLHKPRPCFTQISFCWGNLTHCYIACFQVIFSQMVQIITSCANLVCVSIHAFHKPLWTSYPPR